ncbi:MAG: hypothetical protein DRJ05_09305 [Bacteroidetes bacterium]|nr:MAG: hypothetical protein DRJ05_09305 [Bacteroidota bacterium]
MMDRYSFNNSSVKKPIDCAIFRHIAVNLYIALFAVLPARLCHSGGHEKKFTKIFHLTLLSFNNYGSKNI